MSNPPTRTLGAPSDQTPHAELSQADLAVLRRMLLQQPAAQRQNAHVQDQLAERALIERDTLDRTLPTAKAVLAALGWGNSAITTMTTGAQLQQLMWRANHPDVESPLPWMGAGIGALVAGLLTFAQIYTSGRSAWGYRLCLLPDALTTGFQWCWWILVPIFSVLLPNQALAILLAVVVSIPIGIYSARLPERMVFGKR
jgi:hypothetical protein